MVLHLGSDFLKAQSLSNIRELGGLCQFLLKGHKGESVCPECSLSALTTGCKSGDARSHCGQSNPEREKKNNPDSKQMITPKPSSGFDQIY